MSTKRKRAVLSIKDKQIIISRLDKGEKGTNLAQEFGISKQQKTSSRLHRKCLMILATVVGDLMESESVCSDEEDVSKNACHGWNHRTILTLCS